MKGQRETEGETLGGHQGMTISRGRVRQRTPRLLFTELFMGSLSSSCYLGPRPWPEPSISNPLEKGAVVATLFLLLSHPLYFLDPISELPHILPTNSVTSILSA